MTTITADFDQLSAMYDILEIAESIIVDSEDFYSYDGRRELVFLQELHV